MPDNTPLRIGDLLALRAEFDIASKSDKFSSGARRRASTLLRVLDEAITRREPSGKPRFSVQDVRTVLARLIERTKNLHDEHLAEAVSMERGHVLPCQSCTFAEGYVGALDRALREFDRFAESQAAPEEVAHA